MSTNDAIMPDATEEKVEEYLRRTIIRYLEGKNANLGDTDIAYVGLIVIILPNKQKP
jgi:hypothetical protein